MARITKSRAVKGSASAASSRHSSGCRPAFPSDRLNSDMLVVANALMLAHVFFAVSRVLDLTAPGLHLPLLCGAGALVLATLSGAIVRVVKSRIGIAFLLLTFCFFLSVPFSVWRTGSLDFFLNVWLKTLALFVLVASLVDTRKHCSRLLAVLATGSIFVSAASLITFTGSATRLKLDDTALSDPNALGEILLFGLPLCIMVVSDRTRLLVTRLIVAVCILPITAAIALTGSRGTLVAALAVVAYLFKTSSIAGKITLPLLVLIIAMVGPIVLAPELLERYSGIAPTAAAGLESQESRVYLYKQALRLTIHNPIFGVGIGVFAFAENELAIAQGYVRGSWHTCHNMYLLVASEAGVPAFIIYMWILFRSWSILGFLTRITSEQHPKANQIVRLSRWFKTAFLAHAVCGLFLSSGLGWIFAILAGLSTSLQRIVLREIAQHETEREVRKQEPESVAHHQPILHPPVDPITSITNCPTIVPPLR